MASGGLDNWTECVDLGIGVDNQDRQSTNHLTVYMWRQRYKFKQVKRWSRQSNGLSKRQTDYCVCTPCRGVKTFWVWTVFHTVHTIDIYYYVIRTDNGNMLPEANTRRLEEKYPIIKVLQVASLSYKYIQSSQCSSFTGQAICNLPYFYHSSPIPSYHHVGFNLPIRQCPVVSVRTSMVHIDYIFQCLNILSRYILVYSGYLDSFCLLSI